MQACLWGLLPAFLAGTTWLTTFTEGHVSTFGTQPEAWEVYMAAFYWSAMTVTSIGYGEMLPMNSEERLICSLLMILSGMVWTYILSKAAGIAAVDSLSLTLHPHPSASHPSPFLGRQVFLTTLTLTLTLTLTFACHVSPITNHVSPLTPHNHPSPLHHSHSHSHPHPSP